MPTSCSSSCSWVKTLTTPLCSICNIHMYIYVIRRQYTHVYVIRRQYTHVYITHRPNTYICTCTSLRPVFSVMCAWHVMRPLPVTPVQLMKPAEMRPVHWVTFIFNIYRPVWYNVHVAVCSLGSCGSIMRSHVVCELMSWVQRLSNPLSKPGRCKVSCLLMCPHIQESRLQEHNILSPSLRSKAFHALPHMALYSPTYRLCCEYCPHQIRQSKPDKYIVYKLVCRFSMIMMYIYTCKWVLHEVVSTSVSWLERSSSVSLPAVWGSFLPGRT